ncbi:hypothetical protein PR002_g7145 [Phytophthora rubi]|uniref:Uncharacterized protein n=1 Tax=Phytophthora rubi TaxID=129364 RepID=A0A6A3MT57_9STRA|nr:hypothetical protein PR002_g7145 [Phytophthora rubi]
MEFYKVEHSSLLDRLLAPNCKQMAGPLLDQAYSRSMGSM